MLWWDRENPAQSKYSLVADVWEDKPLIHSEKVQQSWFFQSRRAQVTSSLFHLLKHRVILRGHKPCNGKAKHTDPKEVTSTPLIIEKWALVTFQSCKRNGKVREDFHLPFPHFEAKFQVKNEDVTTSFFQKITFIVLVVNIKKCIAQFNRPTEKCYISTAQQKLCHATEQET